MNKYADDIRRIAKQGKLKGPLGSWQERDPIEGTITPFVTDTFAPDSNGGRSGNDDSTTSDPDNNQPTNPDDPNTFNKGGGSATANETTDGTGVQNVESVIDGEAGPQSPPDNTTSSTSSTGFNGGSLKGLTGATDCSTGQCINFHLDGVFPAPDGWDDPDTPGVTPYPDSGVDYETSSGFPSWTSGKYWKIRYVNGDINSVGVEYIYSAQGALDALKSFSPITAGSTNFTFDYFYVINENTVGARYQFALSVFRYIEFARESCPHPDDQSWCPATEPTDGAIDTAWPEDGCYDLALQDGSFVTNQYDSEAPANAGGSAKDFCFGDGRTGRVYATANGGTMLVETSGGSPTGTARVYASDGTFQAAGDATSTFMNQYLPK